MITVLPVKLALFLSWKSVPERRTPPDAVRVAPVSELTELISNVVTPPAVVCVILVAPDPVNLKSPALTRLAPDASLVTVLVSTLEISRVDPT